MGYIRPLFVTRGPKSSQKCQFKANKLAFAGRIWPAGRMLPPPVLVASRPKVDFCTCIAWSSVSIERQDLKYFKRNQDLDIYKFVDCEWPENKVKLAEQKLHSNQTTFNDKRIESKVYELFNSLNYLKNFLNSYFHLSLSKSSLKLSLFHRPLNWVESLSISRRRG